MLLLFLFSFSFTYMIACLLDTQSSLRVFDGAVAAASSATY